MTTKKSSSSQARHLYAQALKYSDEAFERHSLIAFRSFWLSPSCWSSSQWCLRPEPILIIIGTTQESSLSGCLFLNCLRMALSSSGGIHKSQLQVRRQLNLTLSVFQVFIIFVFVRDSIVLLKTRRVEVSFFASIDMIVQLLTLRICTCTSS